MKPSTRKSSDFIPKEAHEQEVGARLCPAEEVVQSKGPAATFPR